MSTTTPIIESLLSYIHTQLSGITIASGYRTNIAKVSRKLLAIEEVGESDFPILFPIISGEDMSDLTNREIESDFNFKIIGYIHHDELNLTTGQSASELLIKVISDVKEKLYGLYIANRFGLTTDVFTIRKVNTDEGVLEPYAAFSLECSVKISYSATDTGRIVQ